jgi:hypothetical protein
MDMSDHFTINSLFEQLGLAAEPRQVEEFLRTHRLSANQRLEEAEFWNKAQATFLREAIQQDSDWAEVVDLLNLELRRPR